MTTSPGVTINYISTVIGDQDSEIHMTLYSLNYLQKRTRENIHAMLMVLTFSDGEYLKS